LRQLLVKGLAVNFHLNGEIENVHLPSPVLRNN
jgi:hypothetical protein